MAINYKSIITILLSLIVIMGLMNLAINVMAYEENEDFCNIINNDELPSSADSNANISEVISLKEAKLIIEHNAKDEDTGFQGFIDGEGWSEITVTGPGGKILTFKGEGEFGELGLTELFFETVEPENKDVPISDMMKFLPEGNYTFNETTMEVGESKGITIGTAIFTHNIPEGPVLLTPAENATVLLEDLVVSWSPVNKTINGSSVNIISYQLIIEKDEESNENMIGKIGLSMYLPASITEITIPKEFLEPDTDYDCEVLAIEESGNQAIMSSSFDTYN